MLRHMSPPLGLGKRCPARVAYKVRKAHPHLYQSLSFGCRGDSGVVCKGGIRDLSAQRGVNFSVIVFLVLFLFIFVENFGSAGRCCGLCVVVWNWWAQVAGKIIRRVPARVRACGVSAGGDEKEGPSQLVCTTQASSQTHTFRKYTETERCHLFSLFFFTFFPDIQMMKLCVEVNNPNILWKGTPMKNRTRMAWKVHQT